MSNGPPRARRRQRPFPMVGEKHKVIIEFAVSFTDLGGRKFAVRLDGMSMRVAAQPAAGFAEWIGKSHGSPSLSELRHI